MFLYIGLINGILFILDEYRDIRLLIFFKVWWILWYVFVGGSLSFVINLLICINMYYLSIYFKR